MFFTEIFTIFQTSLLYSPASNMLHGSEPVSLRICTLQGQNLSGSGGFRKRKHDNFQHGQRKEEKENVNPSSPLMTSFKSFQLELDTRHDKYERLVKLSRDITIESKRTIFLLHRFTSAPNGEEILNESEVKLDAVRRKIKQVAQELIGEDMYQFHRAISPESLQGSNHTATNRVVGLDKVGLVCMDEKEIL
uniref:Uncharacterized protein n=1 Tax=Anser cygnoides TaxID=8845 RepID=A0A8B9DD39_ANSCY